MNTIKLLTLKSGVGVFPEVVRINAMYQDILKKYAGTSVTRLILKNVKQLLLENIIAAKNTDVILKNYVKGMWREMKLNSLPLTAEIIFKDKISKEHIHEETAFFQKETDPGQLQEPKKNSETRDPRQKDIQAETTTRDQEKKREEKTVAADLIKELETTDGAIISNAGLIILAPFLSELFRACGIFNDNEITDPAKAVAITHYLVYGHCDYREYDVLLNKIICGLDENQPIEIITSLSDKEINEIENLLATVINYWTVLKGTSAAGLREGFLMRKGKLQHKYDEWFLQVEKNTIDVLMQQLPWTIGFIKLCWMKNMLRTTWI